MITAGLARGKRGANNRERARNYLISKGFVADGVKVGFARVRVRVAHRDYQLTDNRPEEWLLIEWPEGEKEPTKYLLSTLPQDIAFRSLPPR